MELQSKKRILSHVVASLNRQLGQGIGRDQQKKVTYWNPGGNKFIPCNGCGQKMAKSRYASKGTCSYCVLNQVNLKRINDYRELSKLKLV